MKPDDAGDSLAADQWRAHKWAVSQASLLAENALKSASAGIGNGKPATTEEELNDFIDAHYFLVDEPASVLRAGLFCQLVGYFEYTLLYLCTGVGRSTGKAYVQSRGNGRELTKERIRFLGEILGKDFLAEESELHAFGQLRNIAAHAAGETVSLEEKRREKFEEAIAAWIEAHPELARLNSFQVSLESGFVAHALAYYDRLFTKLVDASRASARDAAINRAGPTD